jgi:hypothetical protein
VPEAAHAELGQCTSRIETTARIDAGIQDPRAARTRMHTDLKLTRAFDQCVGELPRSFVHPERGHNA